MQLMHDLLFIKTVVLEQNCTMKLFINVSNVIQHLAAEIFIHKINV